MTEVNVAVQTLMIAIQMGLPTAGSARPTAQPVFLQGPPGVGKTELQAKICAVIAKALRSPFPLETIAIPQSFPEHLSGLPVPNFETRTTDMFIMNRGKRLMEAGQGVLFLDELTSGSDSTAASCLTLIQSGTFGDGQLPDSVARVAAGNLPERAVNGRSFAAPESNRFLWIDMAKDLSAVERDTVDFLRGGEGFLRGINDDFILPQDWEVNYFGECAAIVARYLSQTTGRVLREPAPENAHGAWPSPRSWYNATRYMAACASIKQRPLSDLSMSGVAGLIGESAAIEFAEWVQRQDLIDPEVVLTTPNFAFTDEDFSRTDRMYVMLESVLAAGLKNVPTRKDRFIRAGQMLESCKHLSHIVTPLTEVFMNHATRTVKLDMQFIVKNFPELAKRYRQVTIDTGISA